MQLVKRAIISIIVSGWCWGMWNVCKSGFLHLRGWMKMKSVLQFMSFVLFKLFNLTMYRQLFFYPSANFLVIYRTVSFHLHRYQLYQLQLEMKGIYTPAYTYAKLKIIYALFVLHLLLNESLGSVSWNLLAEELAPVGAGCRLCTLCSSLLVSMGHWALVSTDWKNLWSALCCHQQHLPSCF